MANLDNLDKDYRLTPWLLPVHNDYVAGKYGSYLGTGNKAKADEYLRKYQIKEQESDASYAQQRKDLQERPVLMGSPAQELPEQVKLDWDPRKRFAVPETTKPLIEKVKEDIQESGATVVEAPVEIEAPKKKHKKHFPQA